MMMISERFNTLQYYAETPGAHAMEAAIVSLDAWAKRNGIELTYVSGLICLRTNPQTRKQEVMLVRGMSDGVLKEFWQFAGGKIRGNENHIVALHREIHEELGILLPPVTYLKTFVPFIQPGSKKALAIHAFRYPGECPLTQFEYGTDVNQLLWTSDPLREENGLPRILTAQTDYMLRTYAGFTGPANKNTSPAGYHGRPDLNPSDRFGLRP